MRTQRAGRRIGSFDRTYEGLKLGMLHLLYSVQRFF